MRTNRNSQITSDLRIVAVLGLVLAGLVAAVLITSSSTQQVKITGDVLSVQLGDYYIEPANISMQAGRIKISAFNRGVNVHGLRVVSDAEKRGGARVKIAQLSKPVAPGANGELTVCLPAGNYRLVGTIPMDEELGAKAKLSLTPGPSSDCAALPATGSQASELSFA